MLQVGGARVAGLSGGCIAVCALPSLIALLMATVVHRRHPPAFSGRPRTSSGFCACWASDGHEAALYPPMHP